MANIGFIGLGHMGNPMVRNLLTHEHKVKVYDVRADAISSLTPYGAIPAKSLAEVAEDAEVIITMLQTGQQVLDVCTSAQGLFNQAKSGTLFIDSSSIDPSNCHRLHQEAKTKSMAMVDAPVSGGVSGAETGTLTFMVGGSEKNFQRAKPILESMGKTIIHAGGIGTGQAAKICNNMILGISMIAVSEAFNLAKKLGLDAQKLFEISSNSSGQCWSLTHYAPIPNLLPTTPASHNYKPGFAAKMMLKDLLLSQNAAQISGVSTPMGAEAAELYSLFVNQGNGEVDFSGIIRFLAGEKG